MKFCNGGTQTTAGRLKNSKAFCEGLHYREGGTLVQRPKASNPHEVGSEAHDAWDAGWDEAEAVKGVSGVAASDAPCCAPSNATVPA